MNEWWRAFVDVAGGFVALLIVLGLVVVIARVMEFLERCWSEWRVQRSGGGSVVSERATPQTRSSEPVAVPRPAPSFARFPSTTPLAPQPRATLPPNATPLDDAVVEFLYRDGYAERPKV